jgi:amidase
LSVKDVIDVAGMPTTHSCKALRNNVAASDSAIVRRFRDGGFVVLGKTNLPEFCSSMTSSELNGICRNPWNTELTSGGSSGGAGAALAAGLCAVSHGNDGAGSVRVPSSFCGLVGVKPSRGLFAVSIEEEDQFFGTNVDGVLCRSVRDAAALLDVLTVDALSPGAVVNYRHELELPLQPLRIAVTTQPPMGAVDPQCADAALRTATLLELLGHVVEHATPPWASILVAAGPLEVPGAAKLVPLAQLDQVEPRNRPTLQSLASRTILEHARWTDLVRDASRTFLRFWDNFDIVVTPTCGMLPPSVTWAPWDQSPEEHQQTFASFPNFAQPFNISGQPAFSLPLAWSSEGLPIGVQIAARPLAEPTLLRLAAQLEEALPWAGRHPGTSG